jgi:hypothetical protein
MDCASGPLRDTIDRHLTLIETRSPDVRYPHRRHSIGQVLEVRFGLACVVSRTSDFLIAATLAGQ